MDFLLEMSMEKWMDSPLKCDHLMAQRMEHQSLHSMVKLTDFQREIPSEKWSVIAMVGTKVTLWGQPDLSLVYSSEISLVEMTEISTSCSHPLRTIN